MEPFIYELMWEHEESHWWFTVRRDILRAIVRRWAAPGSRVLDVGCGTGFIAAALSKDYRVSLTDSAVEAVRRCACRGLGATRASVHALPYPDGSFDLVGCFDVLYHRRARPLGSALNEIHRVLKPSGILVAAEPAHQWLFGEADVLDHAEERFTARQLCRQLRDAGFSVRSSGYFNSLLAPPIIAARLARRLWLRIAPRAQPSPEFGRVSAPLNALLARTFGLEKRRVLRGGYAFGTSVLCVAQRPGPVPQPVEGT